MHEQRVSLRGDNGAVGFQRKITVSSVALSPHRLDDEESVPLDRQVKRVTCGLNFSLEKIRSLIADRYQPARPFAARRAVCEYLTKHKPLAFVAGRVHVSQILSRHLKTMHLRDCPRESFIYSRIHNPLPQSNKYTCAT